MVTLMVLKVKLKCYCVCMVYNVTLITQVSRLIKLINKNRMLIQPHIKNLTMLCVQCQG